MGDVDSTSTLLYIIKKNNVLHIQDHPLITCWHKRRLRTLRLALRYRSERGPPTEMQTQGSLIRSTLGYVGSFVQPQAVTCRAIGAIPWEQRCRALHDPFHCSVARSCMARRRRHAERALWIVKNMADAADVDVAVDTTTSDNTAWMSSTEGQQADKMPAEIVTPAVESSDSSLLPLALLNTVTILWGTQHAVIKLIVEGDLSPGVTNLARFGLAALLFSPWTPGLLQHPPPLPFTPDEPEARGMQSGELNKAGPDFAGAAETWQAGAELGLWMFLGFAFQAVGLQFTTAR